MKTVLSIAGSDCSGGAGIQADIKTISAHNAYGMTVITALTAQNTTGVFGVEDTSAPFVEMQMDAVFADIPPDAVKIGMVSNTENIRTIAQGLKKHSAKNIVLDPVMVATSGGKLMKSDATSALAELLFPLARVITPNIPEAIALSGRQIQSRGDMEAAAQWLAKTYGIAVLLKGGHLPDSCDDVLVENGNTQWLFGQRIASSNTHGTGCTLSSAIACGLTEGYALLDAARQAKEYVTGAILADLHLGRGNGPLNHMWRKNS